LQALSKFVPPGFYTNKDAFIASLEKEKYFTPFGEKLHSYTHTNPHHRYSAIDISHVSVRVDFILSIWKENLYNKLG